MKTYIALLRGINVSGKNIIKMDSLKEMFTKLNFEKVQTYIQSGNVVFSTNKTKENLVKSISDEIKLKYELNVPVLVLEKNELDEIISELPFSEFEEKDIYFTFLNEESKITDFSKILEKRSHSELIHISKNVIYLVCPDGYGNTKLSNSFLEKQLKVLCTTRNLKTSKKILELASIKKDEL